MPRRFPSTPIFPSSSHSALQDQCNSDDIVEQTNNLIPWHYLRFSKLALRESKKVFLLHPVCLKVGQQEQVVLQKKPPARQSTQTEGEYCISLPNPQSNNAPCCDENFPHRVRKTICYWKPKLILNIDVQAIFLIVYSAPFPKCCPDKATRMGHDQEQI